MSGVVLRVLGQEIALDCGPEEERRLLDLAAALDARLARASADAEGVRRLILTALSLLDEAQAAGAALARSRCEIERLSDLVEEAPAATPDDLGRSPSLTRASERTP